MRCTVVGSGTIISSNRYPSAYLLQSQSKTALLDFGPGNLHRLMEMQVSTLDISAIFLSHFHLDHCADVFPLLLNRYVLEKDSNTQLTIFGPPGLLQWFEAFSAVQGNWLKDALPRLIEMDGRELQWADRLVTSSQTKHNGQSIAYRFNGKQALFYSGDSAYHTPLVTLARNADIALIECSHSQSAAIAGHMSPPTCGQLAREAQVKKLILTHIYPENDTPDLVDRVRVHFPGPVEVARDKMHFEIA